MITTLNVEGMTCAHCKKAVEGALQEVNGVQHVDVDLDTGKVKVTHTEEAAKSQMNEAVEDQGYDIV